MQSRCATIAAWIVAMTRPSVCGGEGAGQPFSLVESPPQALTSKCARLEHLFTGASVCRDTSLLLARTRTRASKEPTESD